MRNVCLEGLQLQFRARATLPYPTPSPASHLPAQHKEGKWTRVPGFWSEHSVHILGHGTGMSAPVQMPEATFLQDVAPRNTKIPCGENLVLLMSRVQDPHLKKNIEWGVGICYRSPCFWTDSSEDSVFMTYHQGGIARILASTSPSSSLSSVSRPFGHFIQMLEFTIYETHGHIFHKENQTSINQIGASSSKKKWMERKNSSD